MKESCDLDTSDHKKDTNCYRYMNLYHAILFRANRAFSIARPNITDVFRRIIHVLKKILTDGRTIF